jgi:hypothetical protein
MDNRPPRWRVGQHYGIHVYEDQRPVATFHTVADARRAVDAVNRLSQHPLQRLDGVLLGLIVLEKLRAAIPETERSSNAKGEHDR